MAFVTLKHNGMFVRIAEISLSCVGHHCGICVNVKLIWILQRQLRPLCLF